LRRRGDNAGSLVASKDRTRRFPVPGLADRQTAPSPFPAKALGLEETWRQPRSQRRSQGLAGVL